MTREVEEPARARAIVPVEHGGGPEREPQRHRLHFWGAFGKPDVVDLSASAYDSSGMVIPASGPATYAWSFGDGQTTTTTVPVVEHDYSAAMNHLAPFSYFNASVTVTTAAGTATSEKIVPIWSVYAANRAKGILQPPNTIAISSSSMMLTVRNYEPTPLSITQANMELIPCDPALPSQPLAPQPLSTIVPAATTANVTLAPPSATTDICTIGMHLLGTAAAGAVRSDGYVRVATGRTPRVVITDPATIALLNQASTLTADPTRFGEDELRALVNAGVLGSLPPPTPAGMAYGTDECNPGDTPPQGMVCEPTSDWVAEPPEILNAFNGNLVMDHGCGAIGKLLTAVGQLYSHNSIITKNRVEVRHSTASSDRITSRVDNPAFPPSTELHPETIQFGFPGTEGLTTHSIDELTHQYTVVDPEDPAKTWQMGGEFNPNQDNKCTGDITAVPPLVLRPDPGCPQPNLQGVVDQALNNASHYRFFMYSHADTPSACPNTLWCSGQTSTVCSLFARNSAAGANFPIWPQGPFGTLHDGMNFYTEDTRTAGANALASLVHDQVVSAVHPWDQIIEGVSFALDLPAIALAHVCALTDGGWESCQVCSSAADCAGMPMSQDDCVAQAADPARAQCHVGLLQECLLQQALRGPADRRVTETCALSGQACAGQLPGDLSAQALAAQHETDQVTIEEFTKEIDIEATADPNSAYVAYWQRQLAMWEGGLPPGEGDAGDGGPLDASADGD